MRTIIFLSAIVIAGASNISYLSDRATVIMIILVIAFAWDLLEMMFKGNS